MNREWKKQSRDGKRFFHAGIATADVVGTEHPASEIPMQEGMRLLLAKAVERWWKIILIGAVFGKLMHKQKK